MTVLRAVQALLASVALQPNNVQAHLLLSRIFRGQRKLNCALHHVNEVLKAQNDSVDTLSAFAFLMQHTAVQASSVVSQSQTSSSSSISDVQQRLCRALNTAAAAHDVLLPPSICLLAPPTLLTQDATYSSQWSTFFRAHMPGHMLSNNFVPGHAPCSHLPTTFTIVIHIALSQFVFIFKALKHQHLLKPPLQFAEFFLPIFFCLFVSGKASFLLRFCKLLPRLCFCNDFHALPGIRDVLALAHHAGDRLCCN